MGPTSPSARSPRRCWKDLTTDSVLSLKTPSTPLLPRSKPRACKRVWRSTTSRPLSPLRSVRTCRTVLPLASRFLRPKQERRASTPGAPEGRSSLDPLALDDPQDVVGVEDHVVLAVEADLGSGVLGEDDDIALANLDPVLELTDRDDLGRLRLLLGRVGEHYPRGCGLLTLDDLDERTLSQRLELHLLVPPHFLVVVYGARGRSYPSLRGLRARDCNRECCYSQLQAELRRHGTHQGAQKSTITGLSERRTSLSKVASVTSATAILSNLHWSLERFSRNILAREKQRLAFSLQLTAPSKNRSS